MTVCTIPYFKGYITTPVLSCCAMISVNNPMTPMTPLYTHDLQPTAVCMMTLIYFDILTLSVITTIRQSIKKCARHDDGLQFRRSIEGELHGGQRITRSAGQNM